MQNLAEGWVVRPALACDLEEIVSLDHGVWSPQNAADSAHSWRLWIDYGLTFVLRNDQEIFGVAGAFPAYARRVDPVLLLHKLFVKESARGQGLGTRLLNATLLAAHFHEPETCVRLTVDPANIRAIQFYKRAGFAELWTEPDYYGAGKNRTVMERSGS